MVLRRLAYGVPGRAAAAGVLRRLNEVAWAGRLGVFFGARAGHRRISLYSGVYISCVLVVVCLHAAANLFNTYYDFVSGTDAKEVRWRARRAPAAQAPTLAAARSAALRARALLPNAHRRAAHTHAAPDGR